MRIRVYYLFPARQWDKAWVLGAVLIPKSGPFLQIWPLNRAKISHCSVQRSSMRLKKRRGQNVRKLATLRLRRRPCNPVVSMYYFSVYPGILLVLLACSTLCTAERREPHPVLKCNSYVDAAEEEDLGPEQLSRDREPVFLLRTDVKGSISKFGVQYRGWFNLSL